MKIVVRNFVQNFPTLSFFLIAEDTILLNYYINHNKIIISCEYILNEILDWFAVNKLIFNLSKTYNMIIHKTKSFLVPFMH